MKKVEKIINKNVAKDIIVDRVEIISTLMGEGSEIFRDIQLSKNASAEEKIELYEELEDKLIEVTEENYAQYSQCIENTMNINIEVAIIDSDKVDEMIGVINGTKLLLSILGDEIPSIAESIAKARIAECAVEICDEIIEVCKRFDIQ